MTTRKAIARSETIHPLHSCLHYPTAINITSSSIFDITSFCFPCSPKDKAQSAKERDEGDIDQEEGNMFHSDEKIEGRGKEWL